MGIQREEIQEEGFGATMYTLTCDATSKKLVHILVRKESDDLKVKVKALSPFQEGANSGEHEINGLLYYGPITKEESPMYPTEVINIEFDQINGENFAIIEVARKIQ
jgi:hypothetical protein